MAYFLPKVTRFGLVCVGMAQAIEPLMSPLHGAMASSKPLCSDFSLSLSGLAGCMIGFEGAQGQQGQRGAPFSATNQQSKLEEDDGSVALG